MAHLMHILCIMACDGVFNAFFMHETAYLLHILCIFLHILCILAIWNSETCWISLPSCLLGFMPGIYRV